MKDFCFLMINVFVSQEGEISIKNGRLKLRVNPKTGFTAMRTMIRSMDKRTWVDINLSLGSYVPVVGEKFGSERIIRAAETTVISTFTLGLLLKLPRN